MGLIELENPQFNYLFQLNCCGLTSAIDWMGIPPASCGNNLLIGCRGELRDFISRYSNIIGWVALGVVAIEV